MRHYLRNLALGVCGVLLLIAVMQYMAIQKLAHENQALRAQLVKAIREEVLAAVDRVAASITEQRAQERDRYFELKQVVQLEGNATRTTVKETCP